MGASPPVDPGLVDEAQVGLVDQRGGLEDVPRTLAAQVATRQRPQLVVDRPHELVRRRTRVGGGGEPGQGFSDAVSGVARHWSSGPTLTRESELTLF